MPRFTVQPLSMDNRRIPAVSVVDTLRGITHGTVHGIDGESVETMTLVAKVEAILLNGGQDPVYMAKHPNNNKYVFVDPFTGQETMR